MIDITAWIHTFLPKLDNTFGSRVWFVGLQGSYGRGEATPTSDIDIVVILDTLSVSDIQSYHAMLETLPNRERICGFFSGKEEILHWDPADLFQFYYDTTPILGSLDALLPLLDKGAVNRAIKFGACNIFHGCMHNMLHEKSDAILKDLYKAASFVVQALVFQQTGTYIKHQKDLACVASPEERAIIETFLHLKKGGAVLFPSMSETLIAWSQKQINQTY